MKKLAIAACGIFLLAGCGTPGLLRNTDDRVADTQGALRNAESKLTYPTSELVERDGGAWFAQHSVVLDEVDALPARFDQAASFSSGRALPLSLMTEQIAKEQGIVIRLARDIFSVSAAKSATGSQPSANPSMAQAALAPLPFGMGGGAYPLAGQAAAISATEGEPRAQINYAGSLRGLLDAVGNRTGTNWNYRNGVVEFSRLITRTFQIKTMPGTSSYSAKVGKSSQSTTGASSSGTSGGSALNFGSDSSVSMSSETKYWDRLSDTVNSMLSPLGKAIPSEMTSSITVTDSADVVERVRRYVDSENAVLGRQVSLSVQVFSVHLTEKSSAGIDWNLVYQAAQSGWGSTFKMAGDAEPSGGVFGVTMNSGQFQGSKILLQALSQQGRVSTVVNTNVVTLNNQPAPVAVTSNQGYLAKITTTPGVSGSAPSVGLEPGLITTGFVMNLLPTLLDNRSVMLQVQIDMSDLKKLDKINLRTGKETPSGSDDASISVSADKEGVRGAINDKKDEGGNDDGMGLGTFMQLPITQSIQTMQRASLKSGDTLVLSGFRRKDDKTDRDGIFNYEGGTKEAEQRIKEIVILISPELTEGV